MGLFTGWIHVINPDYVQSDVAGYVSVCRLFSLHVLSLQLLMGSRANWVHRISFEGTRSLALTVYFIWLCLLRLFWRWLQVAGSCVSFDRVRIPKEAAACLSWQITFSVWLLRPHLKNNLSMMLLCFGQNRSKKRDFNCATYIWHCCCALERPRPSIRSGKALASSIPPHVCLVSVCQLQI